MFVVEREEMRNIEQRAVDNGCTYISLMEKAGSQVADFATKIILDKKLEKIVIVCGRGNNGGDGFVVARLLSELDCNISIILADGKPKTEDARQNFSMIPEKVKIYTYNINDNESIDIIRSADMIIDAIYGIVFKGYLSMDIEGIINVCNSNSKAVRIAVDLPTGINCNSGEINGSCFNADYTITFTTLKPLHILYPAMDYCGEVIIKDVGIPENIVSECQYFMKTTDEYLKKNKLKTPKKSAHKGNNGTLFSLCGSYGMAGATFMSASSAMRMGVGLVKLALPKSIYEIVASRLPEAVFMPLEQTDDGIVSIEEFNKILYDVLENASAVLIGCGLGKNEDMTDFVSLLIENCTKPMVIDADGINAICMNKDVLKRAIAPIILTPHPKEMSRLTGSDVRTVQNDRYNVAKNFAMEYGVTVVLKGANTLIATPDGEVYVNMTGNNGMAKGGSGDVLAGMISGILAQGMTTEKSAVFGVYYHGLAGDRCAEKYSARAMLPTDMIEELKYLF